MPSITAQEWEHAVDSLIEEGIEPTDDMIEERVDFFREQAAEWHAEQAISREGDR